MAVLDGVLDKDKGVIDLPLRVDLEDRPRQLVCYEYGKSARTKWEKIDQLGEKTQCLLLSHHRQNTPTKSPCLSCKRT